MKTFSTSGEMRVDGQRRRRGAAAIWLLTLLVIAVAGQGYAQLTVNPITWDVVGLDHNRPLTSGPELFPVGAEVCSAAATSNVTVDFVWPDGDGNLWDFGLGDPYINLRPGSLTSLDFPSIGAGECVDAYFELQLTRSPSPFEQSRPYVIQATDLSGTAASPSPRAIYIERLVSQNRNTTQQIRYGQQADQSDWVVLGAGGGINLLINETYFIELTTQTATAYEELESFITLSNTIFQVISVSTTYGVQTAPLSRVPDPNPQLWADGCLWESDPDSPNYLSCLEDGKAGGLVVTTYEIRIISGGGDSVGLEALIYDRSGGSFHYNSDYSESPGDLNTIDPADADFSKRFIPSTIGADGISTLRFTVTNPNPLPVSGYLFDDNLPGDMVVASTPNVSNTCGGTVTAGAGAAVISLAGGSLDANSSCTILVDVTVPYDAGATYPLTLNNSVELFVGTATDPSATAAASLEVTEEPPPPLDCTAVAAGTTLAAWATFNSATIPSPTTEYATGIAAAQGGAGLTLSVSPDTTEWRANAQVTGQTLANAISTDAYYEFRLDTTGIDSIDFSLEAFRRNGNAPASLTLLYGPAGSLVQSTTLTPVPTQNNRPGVSNFQATGLTSLNPSGDTLFRVYAYGASNANQPVSLLNVLIQGEGTICAPVDPSTAPDPPTISKAFSPTSVRAGAVSTLTFTLGNPNAADTLTGVTFRDELPFGMTAVSGTFVNSCGTGTWGPDGGDLTIPLFTGGQLAASASCTLSVNVVSSTVGPNVNVSDSIDAVETLPGGTAVATLTVLPPPAPPLISKQFDPNPLLDPTGSTVLTFRITNADPSLDISSVAFVDPLPAGMQPVTPLAITDNSECGAYSLTWNGGTNELTFSSGAITADTVCVVDIEVEVPGVDVSGGPVTFSNQTGLVSHVFNGTTYEGNDAEASLVVDNPIPGVAILKQVGLGNDPDGTWSDYLAVETGTDVYYKITVENIGETTLTNTVVSDLLVDTSSCTWPASLPVADGADPLAHIAVCVVGPVTAVAGTNTNTAGVVTDEVPGPTTDSASYATVELGLDKSASPTTYTAAGEDIDYTFTVTNDGDAILPGPVTITDTLVPGASCPSLTTVGNNDNFFDPSETIDCTGTYTTTALNVSAGSVTNTATATVDGFDSPEDSVTVFVPVPPTIAKAFGSDPVAVGTTSDLTITVTNNAAIALSGVAYSDVLPAGLSFVSGTISGDCGSGTTGISTTTNTNDTFSLSGGAIAASGSCAITVTVSAGVAGSYTNTTSVVSSTEINGTTTGSDTLDVTIAGPTIAKSFADTLIGTGETTTLTITATNAAATALSNVAYTDQLPAGLSFVTGTISGTCGGGTAAISTTTNTNDTFSLSGGAIAASGSCAITVDVSGDVEGSYTNTTSVVTSDEVDGTTTGSDDLDVEDLPTIGKSFDDATVETGETTELTITVTNTAAATTLANVSFSDQLPVTAAGELEYVAPVGGTCSALTGFSGVISDNVATADLLTVSGFDLAAGASCTVTVDVQGNAEGDYTNTTSAVSSTELTGTGTGTDDVEVGDLPTIAKSFATDPINVGATSVLTITATNNAGFALSGVSFSDQLPVGLAYSGTATTDTCGGTTSINAGTRTLSVSGGAIAADSSCTIVIAVQGVAGGTYTNTTSVVDSTELTGTDTGSDGLIVNVPAPTIGKAFGSDPVAVGTTSDLTITVTNNAAIALSSVAYSDQLPAGLSFVTGTISGTCGGGTTGISTTTNTDDTFSLSGGAIAASGSCAITVTVSADAVGSYTNTTSVVSSTEINGTTTGSDTLDVTIAGPTIAKSFADTLIGTGETTTLTITATNAAATALSNVAYTDQLPAGLSFVTGTISGTCGGGTAAISTTTNTNDTFSLSGGAIAASGSCAITVDVSGDVEGSYTNTTSVVTSDEVDGTTTGSDDLDVEDLPTIGKSFDDATVETGETTELTITVTNTAAATTLTNVSFSDQLPVTAAGELEYVAPVGGTCSALTGFSGVISDNVATADLLTVSGFDLAAGASCTVTVDVQGNAEGDYTNTTSAVSSTELTGTGTGTDDVEVGDLPTIAKSFATDPINVGATSVLTITATNNAGFALSGVSFSDQLPVGLAYSGTATTDTCGGTTSINAGTRTLSVSGGAIAADSSCTIVIAVQGVAGGTYTNTTSVVDSTELTGTDTGSDGLIVNVPAASIAIAKTQTSGPDPATAAGDVLGYTIVITNTGTVSQTGVTVTDTLPDATAGTLTGPTESVTTNSILDVGETWTYTISYTVTQADIDAGAALVNTASVVTTEVPGPTTDTESTPVTQSATLTIAKTQTSGPDPTTAAGDVLGYTVVVTNTGTVSQTGVTVTDTLPDATAGTLTGPTESVTTNSILDVGETWTYTISYTVTQADIDAGAALVNTASVVTTEVPGPTTDTETTPVTQSAVTVSASKVSLPGDGTPVATGDAITYALILEVSNGPTTADTVLTDTLGSGLTYGSVTNNPGGFIAGGSGNDRTFTLPSGSTVGTYMVEYSATVNLDATGSTVNNNLLIAGGGDPDPDCTSCSTDHPLESEVEAIPTTSTWGIFLMIALLAGAAALRLRSG